MGRIKAGDIFLYKGTGWISKIIQFGSDSKYSHVSLVVNPEMNLIIESVAGAGVRAGDIRNIKAKYDIYRIRQEYSYDMNKVISFLTGRLGRSYDYLGIVYLAFLKVFQLKGRANKWQREHDYYCSELLAAAFLYGGLNIIPQVEYASVTSPKDIAESPVIQLIKENP